MTQLSDLTPSQAAARMARDQAPLLDVRTDAEWSRGHAPQAVHIPIDRLSPVDVPTDRPVLTICQSGRRSARAADRLAGTHRVHNISGGMSAWIRQGLPIVVTGKTTEPKS